MARQASPAHSVKTRTHDVGMARFFSRTNLERYRKLASGAAGDAERNQIMEALAKEMSLFKREARSVANGRPVADSPGSKVGKSS